MTKRVLVTGASGYAGGVIAARLRADGMEVLTAGRAASNDIRLDLADPRSVAAMMLPNGLDACVHAAALHEVACRNDPQASYVVNVAGTRALLEAGLRAGISRYAYVSTFHVFGRPAGRLNEFATVAPANDYGLTHWQSEQLFALAAQSLGASVDILRPANLFGTPADWTGFDRWTLAPFDFCRQALEKGRIALHGQGRAVRNYLSAAHLADVLARRLLGRGAGLAHVAGVDWQICELARLTASCATAVLGAEVPVEFGPAIEDPAPAYQFESCSEAPEGGDARAAMARFLTSTLAYLKALQR